MRNLASILMSAFLFTGCTFTADGQVRPGWDNTHHQGSDDHYHAGSAGSGMPYLYDTYADCWLIDDGYNVFYAWYFEAIVDGTPDLIDEVWLDVYDGYGLLFSDLMYDSVDYGGWLKPPAAAPYEYRTHGGDGVFMYANAEHSINLKCGGSSIYDVVITMYDVYGNSETVAKSI